MSPGAPCRPRLLFILSDDYGELASALYFLQGQDWAATLVVPRRLYDLNAGGLTPRARPYSGAGEVLGALDAEESDVVFLFSAYLYAVNGLFDRPALAGLLGAARRRGCAVVTSDPFLGVMARLDDFTFNDNHPLKGVFTRHFAETFALLRDVPHLYGGCRSSTLMSSAPRRPRPTGSGWRTAPPGWTRLGRTGSSCCPPRTTAPRSWPTAGLPLTRHSPDSSGTPRRRGASPC
jgi:hypothetical protein